MITPMKQRNDNRESMGNKKNENDTYRLQIPSNSWSCLSLGCPYRKSTQRFSPESPCQAPYSVGAELWRQKLGETTEEPKDNSEIEKCGKKQPERKQEQKKKK